ncbi:MAG: hypothetical protein HY720_05790 [Planctomycetes bacterium]|nr:hypothetical protein [Planctomycetota bacterium]
MPDLDGVLQELAQGPASAGPAAGAILWACASLSRPISETPLPSPETDPVAFRARLEELADWAAASAESGAGYARILLELAMHDEGLTDHAVAFLYDELGRREDSALSCDRALSLCPPDARERIETARRELLER